MTQRNPILTAILYTFIPFYDWYWIWSTAKDLRQTQPATPSKLKLMLFFLAPFILFPLAILAILSISPTSGDKSDSPFYVMAIIGLYLLAVLAYSFYILYKLSEAIEGYTNGVTSKILLIVIFYAFAPIAVYLAQDGLNNVNLSSPLQPNTAYPKGAQAPPPSTTHPEQPTIPTPKQSEPDDF